MIKFKLSFSVVTYATFQCVCEKPFQVVSFWFVSGRKRSGVIVIFWQSSLCHLQAADSTAFHQLVAPAKNKPSCVKQPKEKTFYARVCTHTHTQTFLVSADIMFILFAYSA